MESLGEHSLAVIQERSGERKVALCRDDTETDWSGDDKSQHSTPTHRGAQRARVAGNDRPQHPAHTKRAPMRGTESEARKWLSGVAQCRRSSAQIVFVFLVFAFSVSVPYHSGYSGLGQEKDI